MYRLMVEFEPIRATPVSGGHNEVMNFGNVAVEYETSEDRDHGSGGDIERNLECWRYGGEHTKRDRPKRAKEKEKQNDDGGVGDKRAEVKGGQLHTRFTSSMDAPFGIDFIEMGEDDEFTWHQFHVKGWGVRGKCTLAPKNMM